MAGWSVLTNGSALDCVDIVSSYQSNGRCLDVDQAAEDIVDDSDDYRVKLRRLFDQVLSVFLKQVASRDGFRPIPARLGDGLSLDLFKLFWVVRERGGFDLVSKKDLWALVVEELGLDRGVSSSVKLVYYKYLNELEKWLRGSYRDGQLGNGECECGGNFSLLLLELEAEFKSLLSNEPGQEGKDNRIAQLEYRKGECIGKDIKESELNVSDTKSRRKMHNGIVKRCSDDDDKKICYDDKNDLLILDPSVTEKEFNSRKRKRESLSGMLKWVIQIAKCPDDPSIGKIPEPSKWKEHGGKEFWVQAIGAREALLRRRNVYSNTEQCLMQNNQKMHPSMYEDTVVLGHHSAERLRCSERLPNLAKSRLCSCCNLGTATQSKLISPRKTGLENGPKEQAPATIDVPPTKTTVGPAGDDPIEKHVSVGRLFQAEVPEWTGEISDSDSKWLGTRVWPSEYGEHNSRIETDPVGMGRSNSCGCWLPGSVKCIRFHIAEKRMKLKRELGSVFYRWRFDRMGEEVSLRWTVEEEKRFKDMAKSNSPLFWDYASKCFPGKTRGDLISYYFNVFHIKRRSYQNRVTPKDIDSDDDETEFGSLSYRFGHEAVEVPSSNMLICSQNNQCTDLV